ncbi:MAG: lipid-A-disaccharide synthase [Burkholderiaceae bacterium]|jgi:lipid-A-disaccharide synthase|nr:lipid-A-disaccharide synthase [Aquabacterium sp.]NUP84344.1 lipid-A-disaccharide synthase [Burkholderiaceae bacterium]
MGEGAAITVAMVAGEASGDLLAGLLLAGLRSRWSGLRAVGIGGPRMAAQGFESWWPHERLAVFGYVDALGRLPELLGIRRQLGRRLLAARPQVFVGVDAPDFNFGLESRLRAAGIPTVHFVCPSIWAWRGERVHRLARAADHVLCLFPFEPPLLKQHGVSATFVGHPLADAIALTPPRTQARAALGLAEEATVVALLPGSRQSEVDLIAPLLVAAAARLARARPACRFVLPIVPGLRESVDDVLRREAPALAVQCLDGRSHEALAACDLALVASGTATLEAALFKRPMVITYRMSWLNWQRMKRMRYQPWVGLPNILCNEFVVPERIQDDATPENLASDAIAWLDDPERVRSVQARFDELHRMLRQDTARKASDAIASIIQA